MKHLIHLLIVFLWIIKLQSQSSWTQVSLPATTPATGSLFEIKVLDPQLAFAVGIKVPSSGPNQGLIFKYNGTTCTKLIRIPAHRQRRWLRLTLVD
ncbi:hypothetical protein [Lewinella sp. LCG006]|uniref:hypothetical protein n=1 Tax=Lewinella sp. LCG006 TaxID=3231911 RepID=UPI0034603CA4